MNSYLGRHLLIDMHGVSTDLLAAPAVIAEAMSKAAAATNATVLFSQFHHFGEGQGVTGVLLLKESHMSIHTWPEYGYAALDVFMCGDLWPEKAVAVLMGFLQPKHASTREAARGSKTEFLAATDRIIPADTSKS